MSAVRCRVLRRFVKFNERSLRGLVSQKKLGTERLLDLNLNARGEHAQAAILNILGNFNYVLNGST